MTQSSPSEKQSYRREFIRRVHEWLALGYAELDAASFSQAQEEDITGELVQVMNDIAERLDAPEWLDYMVARDEKPIGTPGRRGKRRNRIDIELVRVSARPRPRFDIEAKRLYRSDSVSQYVGEKGLGAFLVAEYAAENSDGGMLGYVQAEKPEKWAKEIQKKLAKSANYQVTVSGAWQSCTLTTSLDYTYRSQHDRQGERGPIEIFHTLLYFADDDS